MEFEADMHHTKRHVPQYDDQWHDTTTAIDISHRGKQQALLVLLHAEWVLAGKLTY